ncbi:MAG: bifunctional acyl-ACP--phospholipid O-acyltransferase/long-chain-fatty-acid--ACP ligase [Bryobacteraceae bacterium]
MSLIRILIRLLLRVWFRVRVRGQLEPRDRLLIVSNHESLLDGVLLGAFLPVMPVWVLNAAIAKHWSVRLPMRLFPHLVLDTSNPLAMKAVVGLIEAGKPVLLFPEGRVTATGSLMKIYEGPAFAAVKTGATVVPVDIEGAAYSVFSRLRGDFPRKWFPRITITIHPPRRIEAADAQQAKIRRRLGAESLRRIMQEAGFASRERSTLFPALLDAAALHGRRRRMIEDVRGKEWSYGDILRAGLALGRVVSRHTAAGEYVGVLLPNLAPTVALLFGMFATRRVPAMLNYSAGADGLQHACRLANLRLIITSRSFLDRTRLGAVAGRLEGVRLVYLEDLRRALGLGDKLWLVAWARWFPRRAMRPARPEDPAVVAFTSGSEGRPKGVVLSHDAILANVAQCRAVIDFEPSDKFMSALPLFHMFGLTVGVLLPLMSGSRIFLYTTPLHYRVIPELVYDRNCTVLFGSSTFLGHYGRCAHPYDFRNLRIAVAGAEKLAEEVRQLYMEKFGVRILEGYGVTETAPVLSVNTRTAALAGTAGEIFPGVEWRLEPVEGIQGAGLLHVKAPNVMLGYLSETQPGTVEPVRSLYGEGWYNTGDIASIDEAGFIRILGRLKRFAKVAGEMVSLELVERVAAAASGEFQHASAAISETGRGESVILFTEDPHLRREQLQQAAREMGAPELAIPRRIVHVPEIPALGTGKADYVTLNRMARGVERQP